MNRSVQILGTGHALPKKCFLSSELDKKLGLPPGKLEAVGGVFRRYFAGDDEHAASLAAKAAKQALSAANVSLKDIDCLVSASATMDQAMPSNAALVHKELGLAKYDAIPAFDINSSCLGFLAAIDNLSYLIDAGRYQRILLVASDLASCGLNWNHLESSAIFGDGAAAIVLSRAETQSGSCLYASSLKTYSEGAHFCEIPAGGSRFHPSRIKTEFEPLTKFHMNGKKVFRLASKHLQAFVDELMDSASIKMDDIDWIVPHQASRLAIEHMTKRLKLSADKVVNIFANYGNQVAASLPTALDVAVRDGRIKRGDKLLLVGTGAGLTIGGVVMEY